MVGRADARAACGSRPACGVPPRIFPRAVDRPGPGVRQRRNAREDYYETNARTLISRVGRFRKGSPTTPTAPGPGWSRPTTRNAGGSSSSGYRGGLQAGREFDQEAFDRESRDFEYRWADAAYPLTLPEAGDAMRTARELATYAPCCSTRSRIGLPGTVGPRPTYAKKPPPLSRGAVFSDVLTERAPTTVSRGRGPCCGPAGRRR